MADNIYPAHANRYSEKAHTQIQIHINNALVYFAFLWVDFQFIEFFIPDITEGGLTNKCSFFTPLGTDPVPRA